VYDRDSNQDITRRDNTKKFNLVALRSSAVVDEGGCFVFLAKTTTKRVQICNTAVTDILTTIGVADLRHCEALH